MCHIFWTVGTCPLVAWDFGTWEIFVPLLFLFVESLHGVEVGGLQFHFHKIPLDAVSGNADNHHDLHPQVHVDHGILHPDVNQIDQQEEDQAPRRSLEDLLEVDQALSPRILLGKQGMDKPGHGQGSRSAPKIRHLLFRRGFHLSRRLQTS